MTDTKTVTIERDFPYPPEKLWRALTQPHLIAEWLMDNDFALAVGHKFNLKGEWGGVLDCEVLTIEPERILAYTWNHRHEDPKFDLQSTVTFTLTATSAGTRLRMDQSGFRPNQTQALGGATHGWKQFLDNLQELLERPS